jgi:hypothetical protein
MQWRPSSSSGPVTVSLLNYPGPSTPTAGQAARQGGDPRHPRYYVLNLISWSNRKLLDRGRKEPFDWPGRINLQSVLWGGWATPQREYMISISFSRVLVSVSRWLIPACPVASSPKHRSSCMRVESTNQLSIVIMHACMLDRQR